MLIAKEVEIIGTDMSLSNEATVSGRGFAVAGGVAKAVADLIKKNIQVEKVKIKAADRKSVV